jgi:hypothetical protein
MHSMPVEHTFLWYNTDGTKGIVRRAGSEHGPIYAVPVHLLSASPPRVCGSKRTEQAMDYADGVEDDAQPSKRARE